MYIYCIWIHPYTNTLDSGFHDFHKPFETIQTMNKHVQQSDTSSTDESHSLNCALAVRYVQLRAPYSSPERLAWGAISRVYHDISLMPSPTPLLYLFLFLDLLSSAEIREETQLQSVTGASQAPGTKEEDINTYEGSRMILGDYCLPGIENVHIELSTTDGRTAFPPF